MSHGPKDQQMEGQRVKSGQRTVARLAADERSSLHGSLEGGTRVSELQRHITAHLHLLHVELGDELQHDEEELGEGGHTVRNTQVRGVALEGGEVTLRHERTTHNKRVSTHERGARKPSPAEALMRSREQ